MTSRTQALFKPRWTPQGAAREKPCVSARFAAVRASMRGLQGPLCLQLLGLGDGLEPVLKMRVFKAFHRHTADEGAAPLRVVLGV